MSRSRSGFCELIFCVLLGACCGTAAGQDQTFRPVDPDQMFYGARRPAETEPVSTTANQQNDLQQQVRELSAEVQRLRERVDRPQSNANGQNVPPVDLSGQDSPMDREFGLPDPEITGTSGPAAQAQDESVLKGLFDEGWQFRSSTGNFVLRPDVEVNLDTVWLNAENQVQFAGPGAIGPVTDGINIRRGRLGAKGTMYNNFEYMIQYDFNLATTVRNASGTNTSVINSPNPTEVFGMFTHLPIFRNIRLGNQKPLWSFENFTSSRFQNFMERSLGWDAFVEDQDNGFIPSIVMLNHTENAAWVYQAGIAKNNRSGFFFDTQSGAYMAEGRTVITPWFEEEGKYLLHLGVGGMYADTDNGIARFRARTLLRNGSNQVHPIVSEARMFANNESRLVPEFVFQYGSLSIQSEYYMAWAGGVRTFASGRSGPVLGTWYGNSWYVQANYLLTGEFIPYDRKLGRWGRLIPFHNFSTSDGGWGAWMIGARYSTLNLNDLGGVNGGATNPSGYSASSARVNDVSLAVNWIANPNTRIIWDGIYENRTTANTPASNGSLYGFGMRLQFDY